MDILKVSAVSKWIESLLNDVKLFHGLVLASLLPLYVIKPKYFPFYISFALAVLTCCYFALNDKWLDEAWVLVGFIVSTALFVVILQEYYPYISTKDEQSGKILECSDFEILIKFLAGCLELKHFNSYYVHARILCV